MEWRGRGGRGEKEEGRGEEEEGGERKKREGTGRGGEERIQQMLL